MIEIKIPKKVTDENLLAGEKVEVMYITDFNNNARKKIFPDDFTPEQQIVFKQVYEDAVYGSEVGNKIFKCENIGNRITISGYTRIAATEEGIEDFTSEVIKLKFTRHGILNTSVEIQGELNSLLSNEQLQELAGIGISVSGTINQFTIQEFDADISIEVVKDDTDSFIDLGDFVKGKLTFQK